MALEKEARAPPTAARPRACDGDLVLEASGRACLTFLCTVEGECVEAAFTHTTPKSRWHEKEEPPRSLATAAGTAFQQLQDNAPLLSDIYLQLSKAAAGEWFAPSSDVLVYIPTQKNPMARSAAWRFGAVPGVTPKV